MLQRWSFLFERPHDELLDDLGLLGFAIFHAPCKPDAIERINRLRRKIKGRHDALNS